jgi:hypothetical protein
MKASADDIRIGLWAFNMSTDGRFCSFCRPPSMSEVERVPASCAAQPGFRHVLVPVKMAIDVAFFHS